MAQVGVYAQSMLGVHTHADPGQGGQINPETGLNPYPRVDLGDGSDGDVVMAAGVALARNMSYNNLTIQNGGVLIPVGYKVKVKGKFQIDVGGQVFMRGANGAAGAAGVGGTGGIVEIVGRKPEVCLPTVGAVGGNGGGAGVANLFGGVAPDPLFVNAQTLFEGRLWAGAGGGGGGGLGAAPTAGGTPLRVLGGAKGGNGGNAITDGITNRNFGGGGGGGGGGIFEIWCNEFENNGGIFALGGDGGSGQELGACCAGGGGAGGGGCVLIYYKIMTNLGAINVSGGGAGGTLAPGTPGAAGFVYSMKIGV